MGCRSRPGVGSDRHAVQMSDQAEDHLAGLHEFAQRDNVVIATKVFNAMSDKPNERELSGKRVLTSIDDSLERLDADYVDLYQLLPLGQRDADRGDDGGPAGRGAGLFGPQPRAVEPVAWQLAKAQHRAERHGWTKFSTMLQDLPHSACPEHSGRALILWNPRSWCQVRAGALVGLAGEVLAPLPV